MGSCIFQGCGIRLHILRRLRLGRLRLQGRQSRVLHSLLRRVSNPSKPTFTNNCPMQSQVHTLFCMWRSVVFLLRCTVTSMFLSHMPQIFSVFKWAPFHFFIGYTHKCQNVVLICSKLASPSDMYNVSGFKRDRIGLAGYEFWPWARTSSCTPFSGL